MATENTLRYIKFDYQAQKDALQQRIRARYPKLWNDFLAGGFGTVIIDLVSWAMATLAFLVNRQAAENFIPTMTLRESAVRVGSLVGYRLRGPTAASVSCEATLQSVQSANVLIPANTLIRTSDAASLPFEVARDYTIVAGELTPQTTVVTINPNLAGANILATNLIAETGSTYLDLADSTIDITQYVSVGQTFQADGSTDTYSIDAIEAAPGAISNNRLVVSPAWAGTSGAVTGEVFDKRIQLIQGLSVTDSFTAPSSTTESFSCKLSTTPVIDDSVSVSVNGVVWTEVPSLATAASDENVFQVKTFASGVTTVLFGDGAFGATVPTDAIIEVNYRTGGGTSGNIELNTITTSITGIIPTTSSPVTIEISNSTSNGTGGRDSETLEEARVNIPFYARTNDRGVTLEDYQTIASRFSHPTYGAVSYARSAVRNENSLLEGNIVVIYAWTSGVNGGLVNLSPQLKQALQDYLQARAVGTDLVQIYDGTSRPVPISLRFKTLSTSFTVTNTKRLVEDTIKAKITALRPGQPLIFSDLVRSLDEVYGVDSVNMATPIADLMPSNSTELFTVLQSDYEYALDRTGVGTPIVTTDNGETSLYVAQLPVSPVQPWSIRLFLGSAELTVVPGATPGFAEVYGDALSASTEDLTDDMKLLDPEPSQKFKSTVNILTGQVRLWLKGAPGDLTMKLNQVGGYSSERTINVYVGYTGDNSQTKRREIRAAIRAWGSGLPVGGAVYGSEIAGIRASKSNITSVAASFGGVAAVTRVALESPANVAQRVLAQDYELIKLGNIVLNNQVD
ncbi:MAG: hypothetical protein ACOYB3_00130 [Azonexus sp.]